jgi:hypothetical protein
VVRRLNRHRVVSDLRAFPQAKVTLMSTANAKTGSAIEPEAIQKTTSYAPVHRLAPSLDPDQGLLLAQIPDIDPKASPKVPEKRSEGRIINQALSIKLVFGVGLGLVVGAILPFMFGKVSRSDQQVKELPLSWSGNTSSRADATNTSQTIAPAWPTAALPHQTPSTPAPAIVSPQPPQLGDTRPAALTEPAWPAPRPSSVTAPTVTPSLGPYNSGNLPVAGSNLPGAGSTYRDFDRPQDPRGLQADNRNDPAATYRNNDTRYDYRGNPIENTPLRRDLPANAYPRDTGYDAASRTYPPAAGQGSALMPSGTSGGVPMYRDQQVSEPGVARFDGTVVTPPVRTSYDRTGSSTN